MEKIKISSAQFENKSGDKVYNLSVMENSPKKPLQQDQRQLRFTNVQLPDIHLPETFLRNNYLILLSSFPMDQA
jgi:hypothetical protein